jgi:hypothetical protein
MTQIKAWKCDICKEIFMASEKEGCVNRTFDGRSSIHLTFSETDDNSGYTNTEAISFDFSDACPDCRMKLIRVIKSVTEKSDKWVLDGHEKVLL